jgi:hypothetical protein
MFTPGDDDDDDDDEMFLIHSRFAIRSSPALYPLLFRDAPLYLGFLATPTMRFLRARKFKLVWFSAQGLSFFNFLHVGGSGRQL